MRAGLPSFTERNGLVKKALGFPLIPERIGKLASPLLPYLVIEPPLKDYINQPVKNSVDSLLSSKIQIIGGSQDGLGYTATALIAERESMAKKI